MSDTEVLEKEMTPEIPATNGAKRGRGRPKKIKRKMPAINNGISKTNGTNESETETTTLPKKRGRKPKADKPNKEIKATVSEEVSAGSAKRGRGRPKKSQTKGGPRKRGRPKVIKNSARSDGSDEDEADPIDDNTGDEEDRQQDPEDEDED